MQWDTAFVLIIVALALAFVVRRFARARKGTGGCGCSGCTGCCPSQPEAPDLFGRHHR